MRVVSPYGKATALRFEAQRQLARFQDRPVLLAKKRYQQLALQIASVRIPIDIEPARIFRLWAPFQHVEPPGIVGAAYTHMIGYEIEHLPQPAPLESGDHLTKVC